jgi:hypothetical protein
MAGPADIDKQIGAVRDSLESSIVVLRDRGKRELKRARRAALITVGVGAATGVVVVGLLVIRRLQRPPTRRERIERIIPLGWWDRLERGFAQQVPPIQVTVGQKKMKEVPAPRWDERLAMVARSLGAGIASGVATRIVTMVLERMARRAEVIAARAVSADDGLTKS